MGPEPGAITANPATDSGASGAYGCVNLGALVQLASQDVSGAALHAASCSGRAYGRVARDLSASVAAQQGFYLWGRFDDRRFWHNVYLGKAGFGRTAHLRARIVEELSDERALFWASVMPDQALRGRIENAYPKMWPVYAKHTERALKKQGSTHIVWAVAPGLSNSDVRDVESELIGALNPRANLLRPIPPAHLTRHAAAIIETLRRVIHICRPTQRDVRVRKAMSTTST